MTPPSRLPRAYFISGASSGLGAEMTRRLLWRGDSVAVAARRVERLEALAEETRSSPGRITIHPLDVTDAAAVFRVMQEADEALGGLDVVVVNAGRGGGAKQGTGRFADNRAMVETNLIGSMAQIEAALEIFRARDQGHLVLVSSLAGTRGLPGSMALYSATKAALSSIGESLRIELEGSGIDVTTLHPGFIRSPINEGSGFPYMTPIGKGVAAMIEAIDRRRPHAVVPAWPWAPLGWLMKLVPQSVIRRAM